MSQSSVRYRIQRELGCRLRRSALPCLSVNADVYLCRCFLGNFRNNLYGNLHVCFQRRQCWAQIRYSQQSYANAWRSALCDLWLLVARSSSYISPCRLACFALRKMVFCGAIAGLSKLERCPIATPKMPFGKRMFRFCRSDGAKTAISLAGSIKIPTQLFNQIF